MMYSYPIRGGVAVDYGLSFNAHVEAYWVAKKIVVVETGGGWIVDQRYQATYGNYDLDCKVGYGATKDEAIEDLLIKMDC